MREPTTEDTVAEIADGENLTNGEVVSSDDTSAEEQHEDVQFGQEQPEEDQPEEDQSEDIEDEQELSAVELPEVEPLVPDAPPARLLPSNGAGGSYQRRLPIRYGISDNSTRGSSKHPEAKHLTIKLPEVVANFFAGVWVAVKGDVIYVDFFARNNQNDRTGRSANDPWRWIKIKDSGEIAMAINRGYTKSRTDGELVRDYVIGAFKLIVPLASTTPGSPSQASNSSHHRVGA